MTDGKANPRKRKYRADIASTLAAVPDSFYIISQSETSRNPPESSSNLGEGSILNPAHSINTVEENKVEFILDFVIEECDFFKPYVEDGARSITVPYSKDTLRAFRTLLYTGKVMSNQWKELVPLYSLADYFLFEKGKTILLRKIASLVAEHYMFEILGDLAKYPNIHLDVLGAVSGCVASYLKPVLFRDYLNLEEDLKGCFDTLEEGEFLRGDDDKKAYCCKHSLGERPVGIREHFRNNVPPFNSCFRLSQQAGEIVPWSSVPIDCVTQHCCAHCRPADQAFRDSILEYNRRPQKYKLELAKLPLECQSLVLSKLLE